MKGSAVLAGPAPLRTPDPALPPLPASTPAGLPARMSGTTGVASAHRRRRSQPGGASADAAARRLRRRVGTGGGDPSRWDGVLGVVALLLALAIEVLPALLAIGDPDVLALQRDGGWLGSPINRFAMLQTLGMVVPLVLGATAVLRDRGREHGAIAVLVALLGNFLLLRVVLALVVRTVLV